MPQHELVHVCHNQLYNQSALMCYISTAVLNHCQNEKMLFLGKFLWHASVIRPGILTIPTTAANTKAVELIKLIILGPYDTTNYQ